jgi:hypothetical protein
LAGNAANPRVGSGMQQARDLRAEEAVEVVRNHEDGTGFRGWLLGTDAHGDMRGSGRSAGSSMEGRMFGTRIMARRRKTSGLHRSGSPRRIPGEEAESGQGSR